MDSALRPREIQARIRAGQSLADVARVAGVPEEQIEPYAGPVIAEREHVAGLALSSTVRRRGETATHRNLRATIEDRLTSVGVDIDDVDWDAWRRADKRWNLRADFPTDEGTEEGLFVFDLAGRFAVASNDPARWLIGELTDDDELALVRAVSPDNQVPGVVPAQVLKPQPAPPPVESVPAPADEIELTDQDADRWPESTPSAKEVGEEVEAELDADTYHLGDDSDDVDEYAVEPEEEAAWDEAAEARNRSELDVLYDMLGGMAEDSINIYAGLDDAPPISADPTDETALDESDDSGADDRAAATADSAGSRGSASEKATSGNAAIESDDGAAKAGSDGGDSPAPSTTVGTADVVTSESGDDEVYDPSTDPHFDPNSEPTVVRVGRQKRRPQKSKPQQEKGRSARSGTGSGKSATKPVGSATGPVVADSPAGRVTHEPAEPHQPTLDEFAEESVDPEPTPAQPVTDTSRSTGSTATTVGTARATGGVDAEAKESSASEGAKSTGAAKPGSAPAGDTPAEDARPDGAAISEAATGGAAAKSAASPRAKPADTATPDTATPDTASADTAAQGSKAAQTRPADAGLADTAIPKPAPTSATAGKPADQEAEPQDQQDGEEHNEETTALPAAKRRKKKRASVPSWDEIMFGGPPPKK